VSSVPRLFPGETIVCLGTGPSLTQADVDYVRGKARVIAINDAIRLAPWADVLYACDEQWIGWHNGVPEFTGLKYTITGRPKRWPGWQRLRNDGTDGVCLKSDGIRTGRNSGFQAIGLSVHLGASRIVLLGYDMERHHGKSHFFGEHPKRARPSPYPAFRKCFKTLAGPLKKLNVTVVNCSRHTVLEAFPKARLEDVLRGELAVAS
jgi:hypothetical protein